MSLPPPLPPTNPPGSPPPVPPSQIPPPLPMAGAESDRMKPWVIVLIAIAAILFVVIVVALVVFRMETRGRVSVAPVPVVSDGRPEPQPLPPPGKLRAGDGRLAGYLALSVEDAIRFAACRTVADLPRYPMLTPRGETRLRNPTLLWRRPTDDTCHVTLCILPHREVVSDMAGVGGAQRSPFLPQGEYSVEIRLGNAEEVFASGTFRVLPDAVWVTEDAPDEWLLARARAELETETPNPSDALQWLERLSWPGTQTDVALRLRLLALGQLGLHDEWKETRDDLRRMAAAAR